VAGLRSRRPYGCHCHGVCLAGVSLAAGRLRSLSRAAPGRPDEEHTERNFGVWARHRIGALCRQTGRRGMALARSSPTSRCNRLTTAHFKMDANALVGERPSKRSDGRSADYSALSREFSPNLRGRIVGSERHRAAQRFCLRACSAVSLRKDAPTPKRTVRTASRSSRLTADHVRRAPSLALDTCAAYSARTPSL
jgi:hypothetical protein